MKLTRRGHYSVQAMLDLALQGRDRPVSVAEMAQRQQIPAPLLEKLLIELRRAGLVRSRRGVHGGYLLNRPPRQISLSEILQAVGDTSSPLPRLPADEAQTDDWVARLVWVRLAQSWERALAAIALEDLYYDACSYRARRQRDAEYTI
ncbi:MAG: Rrf2 family transcriptional regulator [Oscillatoriales cyanobacterium SM2_1_8]|nr:Rrf2 family transcriptional regulator [Oscillatoriales cyanobacterium SM2_1_8]